jgi:hypothetical protein
MTEYELADLEMSKNELLLHTVEMTDGNIEIFATFLFGYLLVAYLLGSALSRPQVVILNFVYLLFTGYQLLRIFTGIVFSDLQEESLIDLIEQSPGGASLDLDFLSFEWAVALTTIHLAAVVASLYFMWHVRHPKTE